MEDLVVDLTRGNPSSVKTVLASVVLALAVYQLLLAAVGYRRLPVGKPGPAFFTHRASGDMLAVLIVTVAVMCLAVFGFEGDYLLHMVAAIGSLFVLGVKIAVVRRARAASSCLPRHPVVPAARRHLVHRRAGLPGGRGLTMQLLGSIIAAIAIVAATIAVVTSELGPFEEDTERQGQIQDQQEEQQEEAEDVEDRRDDGDRSGSSR